MALQQDYTINLNYVLATNINADDIEKNIQKQYAIKNAYFKVINVSPIIYIPIQKENESESKNTSTIYLEVYDSKKTKVKTTELFKNSLNVLEEGQKI